MEKLTSMHEKHKGYMLQDSTYEECAIQWNSYLKENKHYKCACFLFCLLSTLH
jgi:hypothetical protein